MVKIRFQSHISSILKKEASYRFLCTVVHKARVYKSVVKIGIHNLTQSYFCIVSNAGAKSRVTG